MKNRISVLFSVILGTMLIASCSSVFQPNKRVADIEVKASLSGTLARETGTSADGSGSDTATGTVETDIPVIETTDNTSDDPYSFIDEMLASSDNPPYTYYEIISTLMREYGLSEDAAYDILADKIIENSDFSTYNNYWMQIRTNFGQESEKVYPYAKQMGLIKSYYKSLIQITFNYYKDMEILGFDLSSGEPDEASLENYSPLTLLKLQQLSEEYSDKLKNLTWPDYNPDLTTVSLKLNSVPFDQEVTFTLFINYDSEEGKGPEKFEFTRFVNPGLNVFDIPLDQLQPSSDSGSGGDDEGDPDPDSVVDPWKDYTTYYVSNSPVEGATGSKDDPMSLIAAFRYCTKSYEDYKTKYAIILKDDITLSATLTVPESAYIVIAGNNDGFIKTISAESSLNDHMFSIGNYANLGLSSVNLNGNGQCQLFYCSHSVNEGDTETDPKTLTGTLTMENCTVTDFLGTQDVGIITMATGGEMNITGCIFEDNYVTSKGAIYLTNGTLNLNIEDLLDSSLSSLSTNSFSDTISDLDTTGDNSSCEIYLKGTGIFNETNEFLNSNLYAVHVAGWATLTLNGTYNSGTVDLLKIYSTTDGSISNEKSKNTINVDAEDTVTIDDGGDINKEKPTYTTYILKSTN